MTKDTSKKTPAPISGTEAARSASGEQPLSDSTPSVAGLSSTGEFIDGVNVILNHRLPSNNSEEAKRIHESLKAQPASYFMYPLDSGEKPGAEIPVTINGFGFFIKKATMVRLPMQVVEMLADRMKAEGLAGANMQIGMNANKQNALG